MLPHVTSARRMPLVLVGITVAGALAGLTGCGSSSAPNTCTLKSTAGNGSTSFEQYRVSCDTVKSSDPVRFDSPVNQVVSGPPDGQLPVCHTTVPKLGTVTVYQGDGNSASDICLTAGLVLGK